MTIQVSPVKETTKVTAASQRAAYWATLLELAQASASPVKGLETLREGAIAQAQSQAFPTTRNEEWRFTDLSALLDVALSQPDSTAALSAADVDAYALPEAAGSRVVFVNGQFSAALSDRTAVPDAVYVGALADAPEALVVRIGQVPDAEDGFTALNGAGFQDAVVIHVPRNQVVDAPIHLLFVTVGDRPSFVQPRCLLVADPNSAVTLVEDYASLGTTPHFTNAVTEFILAENAQVKHTRIQGDATTAFHIGKTAISQERTSRYVGLTVDYGGQVSRHNLHVHQAGEQTETVLNSLAYLRGEQTSDTHSAIALTQPHAQTRQLHKTIIDDRAHAIFNGKVFVPQAAQMTDAGQLNRNLLLSPKARVDTKPQLEIVADNVKCTHGAAIGQLEADEVFYLQSRGIDSDSARKLLIYAFAYEILDNLPVPSLKQRLLNQLQIAR